MKDRITILLCCNMSGTSKLTPFVIGKAKEPRCFRGIKRLPTQYDANNAAWMTTDLFLSWIHRLDKQMAQQDRKILLLLDNCSSHPRYIPGLHNVELAFFPPNTTAQLQPCDQGIIKSFKVLYRKWLMRKYLCAFDAGISTSINLIQAMELVAVAWNEVQQQTIVNSWIHSGVWKSHDEHEDVESEQGCDPAVQSLFNRMHTLFDLPPDIAFEHYSESDANIPTTGNLSDGDIVDQINGFGENNPENVVEDTEPTIPSAKDILKGLDVIRLYLRAQDSIQVQKTVENLDAVESTILDFLVNTKQQTKITQYFTKVI